MVIASLTPFKPDPLKKDWGSFKQMRELCDIVIVLCDSCHVHDMQAVTGDIRVDEVVEVHNYLGWEDYTTRMTLLARAAAHKATHVLWLDDDEVLVNVTREKLLDQIREMTERGWVGFSYTKREMWTETHYRNDGIWGRKIKPVIQLNPLMAESVHWRGTHLQRLHYLPYQCGDVGHFSESMLVHYGMASPELRRSRLSRCNREDPNKEFQAMGYDYFMDETGIELKELKQ